MRSARRWFGGFALVLRVVDVVVPVRGLLVVLRVVDVVVPVRGLRVVLRVVDVVVPVRGLRVVLRVVVGDLGASLAIEVGGADADAPLVRDEVEVVDVLVLIVAWPPSARMSTEVKEPCARWQGSSLMVARGIEPGDSPAPRGWDPPAARRTPRSCRRRGSSCSPVVVVVVLHRRAMRVREVAGP